MIVRANLACMVAALLMAGLAVACGGKALEGTATPGKDSGTGTETGANDGGSACVDIKITPSDLSCGSDQECELVRTGDVCTGQCSCGDTPVNTAAAARFQTDTTSLTLEACPCAFEGEPRCLGGQCTLCGFGPDQPAGCGDSGTLAVEGGESEGGESDGGPPADEGPPDSGLSCRSGNDCPNFGICDGPITPASLCIALSSCSGDSDCTNGEVCRTGAGAQAGGGDGGPACRPPCASNDECNYWEACQSDGTCQALSCDQCPSYLTCTEGACGPKACAQDSECPGGYCVDSTCFATLGRCVGSCG